MEGKSSFILQFFLVCVFVYLACGQTCPWPHQTPPKLEVTSRRNQTGHWISQVRIEQVTDNNTGTTRQWTTDVVHNLTDCNGVESVNLVATMTAPPHRAPGYEFHRGVGYYKIHSVRKSWHEARQICAQEGAHLAIINSEEESQVLKSIFAPVSAKMGVVWVLIGFHDLYNEGQFLTVFDEPLTSTGFYRWGWVGLPDNAGGVEGYHAGEDCGSMYTNGGLNDWWCYIPAPFICEQELGPDPVPNLTGSLKCHETSDPTSSSKISLEVSPE